MTETSDSPSAHQPQRCPQCTGTSFSEGFVEDMGQASQGYMRWIPGPLQRGIFGGAQRLGKQRVPIAAYRCHTCAHLVLYANVD